MDDVPEDADVDEQEVNAEVEGLDGEQPAITQPGIGQGHQHNY